MMRQKQLSQLTRASELAGAQLEISGIHNDDLMESATIVNRGTTAQPMSGWALATLRGGQVYMFPDELILLPGAKVVIHSGQGTPENSPHELFWTHEQRWNNQSDTAILFDVHGLEVDRWVYPHGRISGSAAKHRKQLVRDGDTWRVVNEQKPETQRSRKILRFPRERGMT
jgi:hypothetical protein